MTIVQALNHSTTAKAAEILSRYRPIAPRPEPPATPPASGKSSNEFSQTIIQSPYLRTVWPQLQARPTRTRKRGRMAFAPPPLPPFKRLRSHLYGLPLPYHMTLPSPARNFSMQGFLQGLNGFPKLPLPSFFPLDGSSSSDGRPQTPSNTVTLPLLPSPPSLHLMNHQPTNTSPSLPLMTHQPTNTSTSIPLMTHHQPTNTSPSLPLVTHQTANMPEPPLPPLFPSQPPPPPPPTTELKGKEPSGVDHKGTGIDLNEAAKDPEENDFLQQLQGPISPRVIAPQPVRPVGSTISIRWINKGLGLTPASQVQKNKEEIEEEIESEILPAVVSDKNNKVRLANLAYKEMVGQPECLWLETCNGGRRQQQEEDASGSACKRICGEVMLRFADTTCAPVTANGFSCWVTIEWANTGKKRSVRAFCDVTKLCCKSKDYLFAWRFHTREASESGSHS